jgi:soluble lytic murein transglycosylase-like protein
MNAEASNNLDLIKSQLGLSNLAPLEKAAKGLAGAKAQGQAADKKRWKAALDFETMFLSQMYKGMRKSTLAEGDELTQASPGREIFTEMLDNQYASLNSKNPLVSGPQGMKNALTGISNSLASQIYRSLRRAEGADAVTAPVAPKPLAIPRFDSDAGAGASDAETDFPVAPLLARIVGAHARDGKSTASAALSDEVLKPIVDLASKTYGVSDTLITSVIKAESANHPLAVSGAGAKGLMQLMDSTSQDMGVRNPFNAHENVLAGTRYLKGLLERYDGDESKALAAYNAGPGAVDKYRGIPPFEETKNYVETVLKNKRGLDAARGK